MNALAAVALALFALAASAPQSASAELQAGAAKVSRSLFLSPPRAFPARGPYP